MLTAIFPVELLINRLLDVHNTTCKFSVSDAVMNSAPLTGFVADFIRLNLNFIHKNDRFFF